MAAQYYKINYKSDFVLTINSDAGWAVPFCIKFWTGMPSQAYFAGFDGENYVNCRVGETPTQLLVMFDDHHMPIGPLRMQIAYHTTIEEFPDRKFDEVTNPTNVTVDIDGTEYQVMLDFTGETGAEIDFSMPSSGVMSVNGKIGYVTLNAEDVGAQPAIEDLATIRSGAAEGATAVQPDEMTAALAGKQNVIEDLSTIRSGAAEGTTAVQPATLQAELAGKQDTIDDLSTIRSGAAAGATAYQKPGTGIPESDLASGVQSSLHKADAAAPQSNTYTKGEVDTLIDGAISDIDVDDALSTTSENPVQNKVLTTALNGKQDVISDLSTIRSGATAGATAVQPAGLTPLQTALQTIEAVIPSAASAQNQLADKNFVNSSISTNTANFVGTFETLAELQAVQNPTNNDYGFVIETDAQGNEYYDRYKYVAASQQWLFEYKVESTPFTAAQWAAIQSGITSALVTKLNALPTAQQLSNQLAAKQDTISDLSTIRSGAAAGATAIQPAALQEGLAGKQDTISDLATIRSGATAGATAVQPDEMTAALAGKQNVIEDLSTIRSGAAAGATAVQPAAMNTALTAKQDTLTFDNTPTANSNNPVKSSGIKTALDAKQDTISDLATIRSNASAGATAYQKPGTGIPSTDFASAVQTSLGKADTAVQSVTVGTTTTGAAGTSASVTNTGTATAPVLNFTIPQGAQGVKGDTVIMGSESSYTLYNTTGDAVDGAMTQQAVTRELTELAGELEEEYSKTSQIGVGRMAESSNNAGIGCVFDYTTTETMCLSAIALYTAYTGTAYFAIASISEGSCLIEKMHEIELDGLYTDLFDLGIIVPAGKSVGLFGVTNSHSLSGSGYYKMGTPPTVGQSITSNNNVMNATILLSTRKSNSSILEEMTDNITFKNDIEVGDLSGTTNASGSYLYATKATYDKDYWVTRLTLKSATTGYVSVFTGTPSQDGTTMTVESLVPIYFDGVDSVDLSDYKIFLKSGCCIGVKNCGKVIRSSDNGYSANSGQTGTILNSNPWIPSVKWTFSEEYTVKNKINNIDEEISDIEDSLVVESDEITIGLATGGSGFDGYGGIYKDQMDDDKYLKSVSLETPFSGTAYILVAEKTTQSSCTIVGKYEITLNGSTTDVSSYNIVVPKDHCVGMMGPSNSQLYSNSNSWFCQTMPNVGTVITKNNWAINASFTLVSKKNVGESVQFLSNQVSEFADSLEKMSTPSSVTKSLLYNEDLCNSDGSAWVESASGIMSLSSNGLTFTSSGDSNYIQLARMYALNGREMAFKAVLYSDTILKFGQKLYNSSNPTFNCTINCQSGTITVSGVSANFTFVNGEEYMIRWIAGLENTKLYVQSMKSGEHVVAQSSRSAYLDTYVFSLNSGTSPVIKNIKIDSCVANPYIIFMGDSITQGGTPSLQYMYGSLIGEQLGKPYGVSGRGQGTINSIVGEDSYIGRLYTEVEKLRPKYLVVMIGTNSGNTAGNLSALCTACEAMGVTLILNNIPCSNDGSTTKNDLIAEIRNTYGLEGMRMDLATSVDNNGATPNSSLYADTNLHPNAAGHYQMYLRSFVDTPDIYINAGVEPIAEEAG